MSTTGQIPVAGGRNGIRRVLRMPILQGLVLIAVLVAASLVEAGKLTALGNANSWLQLQVGNWILAHHAVPHNGVFSQSANLPWADPNWGLQVTLAVLYRVMGLRALPFGLMMLRMLFALALFLLARGSCGSFWRAAGISLWAQAGMLGALTPPFALLFAVFLAVELGLLLHSRCSGRVQASYWIPPLIFVWANFDWHFVFGAAVFCLFVLVCALERLFESQSWEFVSFFQRPQLPLSQLGIVAGATLVASLLSPSSYHSYVTAWQDLFGNSPLVNSLGMKSLTFREPQHYALMFLAMFAFFLLGRRQARDLFQVILLATNVCLGFAVGSETWIATVTAVAVIGGFLARRDANQPAAMPMARGTFSVAAGIAAGVLIATAMRMPARRETLLDVTAKAFPVRACDFIQEHKLPGPLFNELEWGGFVVWYLPDHPVAIDDRYELYGEEKTKLYYGVTGGQIDPTSDPDLTGANTVLLSSHNALIKGLEIFPDRERMFEITFPGFHEVYRDELAVVLTKQP